MDYLGFETDMGCKKLHAAPPTPCTGWPTLICKSENHRVNKTFMYLLKNNKN